MSRRLEMIFDLIQRTDGQITSDEIEKKLKARSAPGREAYAKGRRNEAQVADQLHDHAFVKDVYLVPSISKWDKRDRRGIDIVADLHNLKEEWRYFDNRIYAQVKSSATGVKEFKQHVWGKMVEAHFDWFLWILSELGIEREIWALEEKEVQLILKCYLAERRLIIIIHGEMDQVHKSFAEELAWLGLYHRWKNREIALSDLIEGSTE